MSDSADREQAHPVTHPAIRKISIIALFLIAILSAIGFTNIPLHAQSDTATGAGVTDPIIVGKAVDVTHAELGESVTYTISIQNNSAGTIDGLRMEDALPVGLEYIADSVRATSGTTDFNGEFNQVGWSGVLDANTAAVITFQARIQRDNGENQCGRDLLNKAVVIEGGVREFFTPQIAVRIVCPDLGDAPDSTNHMTATMAAYPSVPANFPTVFDPGTGAPSGPRHRHPLADAWLGNGVSGERDADLFPDEDGITNLKPLVDEADLDHEDDGIVKKAPLTHCTPTEISVLINVVGQQRDRFVNVWFDWNRDGDWGDQFDCPNAIANEWAIQNAATTLGPGQHEIKLPVFFPYNQAPDQPLWARVTLADIRAPLDTNTQIADGRGPLEGYLYGETEDYLIQPTSGGEPNIEIKKQADVTTTVPGGLINYTIELNNSGTATATNVVMIDPIPAGTTYVANSLTSSLPNAQFDTANNQVKWTGSLAAGGVADGKVTLSFQVKVNDNVECSQAIHNRAAIIDANNSPRVVAEAEVRVRCADEPLLEIQKRANVTETFAGGTIAYDIMIGNSGNVTATGITMIDLIPAGTMYISGTINASLPAAHYDQSNNKIKWTGDLGPGEDLHIKFEVKVTPNALCEKPIRNRAAILLASGHESAFAEVDVKVRCQEQPELSIVKEVDNSSVAPGGVLNYKVLLTNHGTTAATGLTMLDPIPAGTTMVAGSLNASAPTATFDAANNKVRWDGDLPANTTVKVTFQVTVKEDAQCESKVHNRAVLFKNNTIELAAEADAKVICTEPESSMDFGDAPDSQSNHHGKNNTAYPSVLGNFPTVWGNTPTAEGSGPAHAQLDAFWLGKEISAELDADLMPDADGKSNILDNGTDDVADMDRGDDGWLNPGVPMENCRETMFHVRVSRGTVPVNVDRLYLNVWFDGNRDGDWADRGDCATVDNTNRGQSFEWIVHNYAINVATIPANGFVDLRVPSVLIYNSKPEAKAWMRFTLSESPATRVPTQTSGVAMLPDGRGPAFPDSFRLGETEDYLRPGVDIEGKPGKIGIDKTVETADTTVRVGDVATYTVYLTHNDGTAPASTVMTDILPAEVALAGRIQVVESNPSATPLFAGFNPSVGPSGAIQWRGQLSPDAAIKVIFPVKIKECPRHDDNSDAIIHNVASALQTDGSTIRADKDFAVECEPDATPELTLRKTVAIQRANDEPSTDTDGSNDGTDNDRTTAENGTESGFLSGDLPIYVLRLESGDTMTRTVVISDSLPQGLMAVGVSSNFGIAHITAVGTAIEWKGDIGPGNTPAIIKIEVRPTPRIVCGKEMVNIAHWKTSQHSGESNPVTLFLVCRDLGDAPDSSNHVGVTMEAYSGVKANFPTVFNVAAPERGPLHKHAQPFHLGQGVSSEVEADISFDADGIHNIEPSLDRANLDRRDDGLRLDSVNLRHCEFNTFKVAVSIDSAALSALAANDGLGYLNVWVDSNRDGDWADSFDCPRTDEHKIALEHIVIDLPINAAVLGAGLHELLVDTTVPVAFPAESDVANLPAWLRLTLSEKPSNKTITTGTLTHGDGRGYETPFRLGETEDYLLRAPSQNAEADVAIEKRGHIQPEFDRTSQTRFWQINWVVNYRNIGGATATDVALVDTMGSGQTLQSVRALPPISPTISGSTVEANLSSLPSGAHGTIVLQSVIPYNTAPGTVLENRATINAANDSVTINNSAVATVTVPLLPPLITSPVPGTTCTGTMTVTGHAQAGVTIELYVDNALAATTTADGNGDWSTSLTLSDGTHDLYAVASQGAITSGPTPVITIIVDSSLFWNPLSLRFTDENGRVIRPSGRLDESGWSVFLRAEHTYTISVELCCDDPNAQVELELNGTVIPLSDDDGDGIYTATFTSSGRQVGSIRICVVCELIKRCSDGELTIDPEGTVFDILSGTPINAADVACFQSTGGAASTEQSFALWPAADYGQINPQSVAADGYFSFFTPPGTYQLTVEKDGYQSYRSWDLVVVDTPVHFDVPLTPLIAQSADQRIDITDDGFEPAVIKVTPGSVVEWTNIGDGLHTTTSITPTVSFDGSQAATVTADSGAWDSGLLTPGTSYKRQLMNEGTYTYRDSENPAYTATVIVAEKEVSQPSADVMIFIPLVNR